MTCEAKERVFCKVAARLAGDLLRCKMGIGPCGTMLRFGYDIGMLNMFQLPSYHVKCSAEGQDGP